MDVYFRSAVCRSQRCRECAAGGARSVIYGTVGQALTQAWKAGIEKTVKSQPSVTVQALDAQMKAEIQVTMMDDFINQGYNAIILQPIDAAALTASVKKAEGKGIHVITLNTDTMLPHAACVYNGRRRRRLYGGENIGKALGGKGNVAILQCRRRGRRLASSAKKVSVPR